MIVVSTGNGSPHKERCIASVKAQRGVTFVHHYVDAAQQRHPVGALENLNSVVMDLPRDEVVAMVDGDDYLPHDHCLSVVKRAHEAGAWLTWGSFVFADGRPGIAAPHPPGEDPRESPWRMSHLKSFRAGLFQSIRTEDLRRNGDWLVHARDLAIMFPMFDLCPPSRRHFISDVIYVYDLAASFEWSATEEELAHEQEDVKYVRTRERYAKLEVL
jgi:hypothetical protein